MGGRRVAEVVFGLGLLALGLFIAAEAASMSTTVASYARVGPRLFPGLIAGGLCLAAVLLILEAVTGRGEPADPPAVDAPPLAWVVAGLALQMVLIPLVGFMLASTVMFVAVARAFGSRSPPRDLVIGFLLCLVAQLGFTLGLGLRLPYGLLERLV